LLAIGKRHFSDEACVRIRGAVALVTGADSGIGTVFVEALVAEGARRVYACARDGATLPEACSDGMNPEIVIPLEVDPADAASVRRAVEAAGDVTLLVNTEGTAGELSAFIPVLAANRPAAIVNAVGALSATEAFRREVAPYGIAVVGAVPGFVPAGYVVAEAFDAVENPVTSPPRRTFPLAAGRGFASAP
jgi:NAD(P)-dependent dehydrogenase (short-subunit alcohol dehydrogenase family)